MNITDSIQLFGISGECPQIILNSASAVILLKYMSAHATPVHSPANGSPFQPEQVPSSLLRPHSRLHPVSSPTPRNLHASWKGTLPPQGLCRALAPLPRKLFPKSYSAHSLPSILCLNLDSSTRLTLTVLFHPVIWPLPTHCRPRRHSGSCWAGSTIFFHSMFNFVTDHIIYLIFSPSSVPPSFSSTVGQKDSFLATLSLLMIQAGHLVNWMNQLFLRTGASLPLLQVSE